MVKQGYVKQTAKYPDDTWVNPETSVAAQQLQHHLDLHNVQEYHIFVQVSRMLLDKSIPDLAQAVIAVWQQRAGIHQRPQQPQVLLRA